MSQETANLPSALMDYYSRIGAEVLNFKRAMIKIRHGQYYTEKCLIKVASDGTVTSSLEDFNPTEAEQAAIKSQWTSHDHPRHVEAEEAMARDRISWLRDQKPDSDTHIFYSRLTGRVIMLQQRFYDDNDVRQFIPHTLWSDGKWRTMEPEERLPLWKPKKARKGRIMVHEGSKAAMAAEAIATDPESTHPWREFLAKYEHWGMIGGALAPHRTDWNELKIEKPEMVIYFCDNDEPGRNVPQKMSKQYKGQMMKASPDKRWPMGWDMADPMPKSLFREDGSYKGPCLEDILHPATWATERTPSNQPGRPGYELNSQFVDEWFHSVIPEAFIHKEFPNRVYTKDNFNNLIAPFSDVSDVAAKLVKHDSSKGIKLTYNPSIVSGIYNDDNGGGRLLNTYVPSKVVSTKGDITPFMEFMEHLIKIPSDRHELLKWIVTLVGRPDIKMHYGVLLISEKQGVGKGTLGEKILMPLVGHHNCSSPSEQEMTESAFDYWSAYTRLAVVHEIYAGHSAKAYDRLKSKITDDVITVNQKYLPSYKVDNWVHVLACSNSNNALKLSLDDRRWLVPKVTLQKKPSTYWIKLNDWLANKGGLGIIKHWCEEQVKDPAMIVLKGEDAPITNAKTEVITEGFTDAMRLAYDVLCMLKEEADQRDQVSIVLDTELVRMAKELVYQGRANSYLEKPRTMRKVAESAGYKAFDGQINNRGWGGPHAVNARILIAGRESEILIQGSLERVYGAGRPVDLLAYAREKRLVTF
jgi:hypothetical protein